MTSGRPVASHAPAHFASTVSSSGRSARNRRSSEPSSRSSRNRRSRPRSVASSAPIQRIAGPMRGEELQVRPDAERDDGDHREEEDQADERAAAACSDRRAVWPAIGGKRRDHAATERRASPSAPTGRSRWVATIAMPPPARCVADQPAERRLGGGVERGRRLVEEPERPRREEEPRDRRPAASGRRRGRRPAGRRDGRGRPRRAPRRPAAAAPQPPPEAEILAHGQRRLQRVEMAEIVDRAPRCRRRRPARARRVPAAGREQPGDEAEQRRFARRRSGRSRPAARPPPTANERPAKTVRPPRTAARSVAGQAHGQPHADGARLARQSRFALDRHSATARDP